MRLAIAVLFATSSFAIGDDEPRVVFGGGITKIVNEDYAGLVATIAGGVRVAKRGYVMASTNLDLNVERHGGTSMGSFYEGAIAYSHLHCGSLCLVGGGGLGVQRMAYNGIEIDGPFTRSRTSLFFLLTGAIRVRFGNAVWLDAAVALRQHSNLVDDGFADSGRDFAFGLSLYVAP